MSHTGLQTVGRLQTVPHLALGRGHRRLPRDHPVADCRQCVNIGIATAELGGGVLLRRGVARVQLAFQLAAPRAQGQRAVARQAGRTVNRQQDIVRADTAVDQPEVCSSATPSMMGCSRVRASAGVSVRLRRWR